MICNGYVLEAEEAMARILAVGKPAVDALALRIFGASPRARFAFGKRSAGVEKALGLPGSDHA
jgi:hypothetical protein